MSEQLHEQISAFVDGELPEPQTELLLKRVERDAELRALLVRYTAIGAGVRAEPVLARRTLASRVQAAIAAEQTQAPRRLAVANTLGRAWLRPVAGFAVAATVAIVAILGVQQLQGPGEEAVQVAANPAAVNSAISPVVIGDLPISETPSYTVPAPTTGTPIMAAARLTNYVVAHSQYSSAMQRRNVLTGIIAEDPTPLDESGQPVDAAQRDATVPAPRVEER